MHKYNIIKNEQTKHKQRNYFQIFKYESVTLACYITEIQTIMRVLLPLFILVAWCFAVGSLVATSSLQQHRASHPRLVWNAPTGRCHSCSQADAHVHLENYGVTSNGNNMTWFGPEMIIFYSMGLFPTLHGTMKNGEKPCWATGDKQPCTWEWGNITVISDGGVPQRANLTAHLAQVKQDIDNVFSKTKSPLVPSKDQFDGFLVIDWERWRIPFDSNYDELSVYTEYSRRLVAAAHPEWNTSQVAAAAEVDFNSGAQAFFTATIRQIKELVPHCRIGFYEYPYRAADVEALSWLWQEIDLLTPSFYASNGHSTPFGFEFSRISGALQRAIQVRQNMKKQLHQRKSRDLLVVPYVLDGVYLGQRPPVPFSPQSVALSYLLPLSLGADGAILWGSSSSVRACSDCEALATAWKTFGPLVKRCLDSAAACAHARCRGNSSSYCAQTGITNASTLAEYCAFPVSSTRCIS